jgi:hypothetical protein
MQVLTCFFFDLCSQVSLYQLVDGQEYKFDIPSYQRPYSWRHKQVLEMLQVTMQTCFCHVLSPTQNCPD